jgi:type III restriction enzyme
MVQAIDKPDSNAVYQEAEQASLWGASSSGIAVIAAARPVVIIDEPQNMATELRRRAIATLNPLFALRYSATHPEAYNLVHRLGPHQAFDLGLVKRVSVKGVIGGSTGRAYLQLRAVRAVRRRLSAELLVDQAARGGVTRAPLVVQVATTSRN